MKKIGRVGHRYNKWIKKKRRGSTRLNISEEENKRREDENEEKEEEWEECRMKRKKVKKGVDEDRKSMEER